MGTPKAALEWHGSTLLRRTAGILARVTDGPVLVVRAPGQELPALPPRVEVVEDPAEGLGPVQGLAAGLAALSGRAEIAFVSSTDMPFLHPAFVRRVLRAAADGADVGLPLARGYPQPLAAAYRVAPGPRGDGPAVRHPGRRPPRAAFGARGDRRRGRGRHRGGAGPPRGGGAERGPDHQGRRDAAGRRGHGVLPVGGRGRLSRWPRAVISGGRSSWTCRQRPPQSCRCPRRYCAATLAGSAWGPG